MNKLLLVGCLLLASCKVPAGVGLETAPAPLARTVVDDTALRATWQAFDIALDGIKLMREQNLIVVGSPKALKIADGIERVIAGLEAAEHAVAAGSTTSYLTAMTEIRLAVTELRTAVKGN